MYEREMRFVDRPTPSAAASAAAVTAAAAAAAAAAATAAAAAVEGRVRVSDHPTETHPPSDERRVRRWWRRCMAVQ